MLDFFLSIRITISSRIPPRHGLEARTNGRIVPRENPFRELSEQCAEPPPTVAGIRRGGGLFLEDIVCVCRVFTPGPGHTTTVWWKLQTEKFYLLLLALCLNILEPWENTHKQVGTHSGGTLRIAAGVLWLLTG